MAFKYMYVLLLFTFVNAFDINHILTFKKLNYE